MNRFAWSIAVVMLMVSGAVADQPLEQPVPEIWREIEKEAKALSELAATDYEAFRAARKAAVRRIAAHSDRSTIETLVRTADVPLRLEDSSLESWSMDLSARVIVAVVDPKDEYGLKSAIDEIPQSIERASSVGTDWYGVAVAAIDVYHDDVARDLLVEITCKELSVPRRWEYRPGTRLPTYTFGFLRTYEAKAVLPRIEAALRAEDTLAFRAEAASHYLAGLRSSLEYSARMKDPAERARYHDFERRLWRAWGLTRYGSRKSGMEFYWAAEMLVKHWKEGDERFVLRIFEDPTGGSLETEIAVYLAGRLSADGRKRLKAIAEGTSSKADAARRVLDFRARIKEREAWRKANREKREAQRKAAEERKKAQRDKPDPPIP